MIRARIAGVALVASAVVALAGCSSGTAETTPSAQASEPSPPASAAPAPTMSPEASAATAEAAPAEVPEELQFEATLLADGAHFDGASLAGQNALIWIWAPWCPVCQAEAPEVAAAAADLPEGVALYGLPGKADAASSQAFVDEHELGDFPHIFSEDGSVWERFGITYQPALVLIGSDGSVEAIPGATGTQGILDAARELADR